MSILLLRHPMPVLLPLVFLASLVWQLPAQSATVCQPGSTCVSVDGSKSSKNNTVSDMQKEQWNDTKMLRQKMNQRSEKEFDKQSSSIDNEERCHDSANISAYWESSTQRCLDRKTGRKINP